MRSSFYNSKTIATLKGWGWKAETVQRFLHNGAGGFMKDLFGIIDIIAIRESQTLGVQVTSWTCRKAHLQKLCKDAVESTKDWLRAGNELWLVLWKKEKRVRGGKAFRYLPIIEEIDFAKLIEFNIGEKNAKEMQERKEGEEIAF